MYVIGEEESWKKGERSMRVMQRSTRMYLVMSKKTCVFRNEDLVSVLPRVGFD